MPLVVVTDNGPAFKSIDFAGFIRARPWLTHVRTRHRSPETNGVIERFFGTLKYEHLYRLEIADVVTLVAEVEAYRLIYNTVRPHEGIGFDRPMDRYLSEPAASHLSQSETVQNLDAGHYLGGSINKTSVSQTFDPSGRDLLTLRVTGTPENGVEQTIDSLFRIHPGGTFERLSTPMPEVWGTHSLVDDPGAGLDIAGWDVNPGALALLLEHADPCAGEVTKGPERLSLLRPIPDIVEDLARCREEGHPDPGELVICDLAEGD